MTGSTSTTYHGRWRRLRNEAAEEKGSIHDDEIARAAGFEAAFVPGNTVGTAAMPAIFDRYGPRWMEGGWCHFKFISPVYEHDEVREVAESVEGADDVSVRIETRKGRLCCLGRAGLGREAPWEPELDGAKGAEDVLPDIEIGLTYDEAEFTVTAEAVTRMLDAAGEESPWYREKSPWGGPVVPPEWLMGVALRQPAPRELRYEGVRGPGIWSAHWLVVRAPLLLGTPYRMGVRIVDKGRAGRMVFLTTEFSVRDEEGAELATGRHQAKWFPA